jgi:hypothetical protein
MIVQTHMAAFISLCYFDGPTSSSISAIENFSWFSNIWKEEPLTKNLVEDLVL